VANGRVHRSVPEPWTTERPKILVIADDQDAGELLARLIDRAGWTTDLAYSPASGLGELEDAAPPFSAVVLDLTSTAQSIDVLRAVRDEPATAAARVVICARSTSEGGEAWITGADGYLLRPFEADTLIDEMTRVVSRPEEDRDHLRQQQLNLSIPDAPD
jgi:DNA-binding response OmpR family regulator